MLESLALFQSFAYCRFITLLFESRKNKHGSDDSVDHLRDPKELNLLLSPLLLLPPPFLSPPLHSPPHLSPVILCNPIPSHPFLSSPLLSSHLLCPLLPYPLPSPPLPGSRSQMVRFCIIWWLSMETNIIAPQKQKINNIQKKLRKMGRECRA